MCPTHVGTSVYIYVTCSIVLLTHLCLLTHRLHFLSSGVTSKSWTDLSCFLLFGLRLLWCGQSLQGPEQIHNLSSRYRRPSCPQAHHLFKSCTDPDVVGAPPSAPVPDLCGALWIIFPNIPFCFYIHLREVSIFLA